MNYLTNYYKNLCEQLQEKLNILEAQVQFKMLGTDKPRIPGKIPGGGLKPSPFLPSDDDYLPKKPDPFVPVPGKIPGKIPGGKSPYLPSDDDYLPKIPGKIPGKINPFLPIPKKPKSEAEELIDMRRKAAEEGGIPDDMVNEPLPQGVSDQPPQKKKFDINDISKMFTDEGRGRDRYPRYIQ